MSDNVAAVRSRERRFRPGLERCEGRALLSAVTHAAAPAFRVVAPSRAADLGVAGDDNDRGRFASEREKLTRRDFPLLGRDYEVIGPSTSKYNCVAHVLGVHDRWVSIQTGPRRQPLAWLDRALQTKGFHRSPGLDTALEAGAVKIAAYGYTGRGGGVTRVRHVALQAPDGSWTSKLGTWALIRHPSALSVAGPLYGKLIAVYSRPA